MVKKKISVGKYFRKKGGKTESVKAHDKTVNVKHNLSNNNRNAVINGNTKPLFNGKQPLGPYIPEDISYYQSSHQPLRMSRMEQARRDYAPNLRKWRKNIKDKQGSYPTKAEEEVYLGRKLRLEELRQELHEVSLEAIRHNLSKEDYEKLSERQNELWDEYLEAHPRLQEYAVKHNLTNNDLRLLINQRKKDLEVSDKDYDQFLKTPDKVQKELIEATKKEIKETQRLVDPLSFNTNPKSKQIANSIKRTNENRLKQIAMQELYFEKAKDEMKENPKKR